MSSSLQHRGVVESVAGDRVVVSVVPESACAGCHAKGICDKRGDKREIVVRTPYAAEFTTGEHVIVALEHNRMGVMSVVWSYVLPLVVLLGVLLGTKACGVEDGVAALSSMAAMVIYFVALYLMRRMFDRKIKFTIIKDL
ncbi:MAG: SoxR reducing system RseC family protein [Alistipes sp.]|jgi:sigma-E factor negative regulatory protein RseC|nr:SoxR reducing system RseC family protein [Alistipes sp.]